MRFRVVEGREKKAVVWTVEDTVAGARASVRPGVGFNCYSWQIHHGGREVEMIYATDDFFAGGSPTRTGVPVLFPFPNRIRDGRFTWDGQAYALPTNDPAGKNAIHGFACRRPWRVVDSGADENSTWVTGEFASAQDATDVRGLWPADYALRLTLRLGAGSLRFEAVVQNPDTRPLPFGLGYHPYFRISEATAEATVPAEERWLLDDCLPSGARRPVPPECDLRSWRSLKGMQPDDVLTGLTGTRRDDGLRDCGAVRHGPGGPEMRLWAGGGFRDVVVFIPPHRQAVCLEPYTCVTDAVNLSQRGVETGWQVLPAGGTWAGVVELRIGGG